MRHWPAWSVTTVHLLIAMLVGIALGSIVQTQFNLAALQQIGAEISMAQRLMTTLEDLITFAPVYALLFSPGFLISQGVALVLSRMMFSGRYPVALCGLLAMAALFTTLVLVNHFAPIPTLIAATRTIPGTLAMVVSAGIAGVIMALLQRHRPAPAHRVNAKAPLALLLPALGAFGFSLNSEALAQAESAPAYRIETVAEGLEHPWSLAFLPDGRMLVTERPGRLRLLSAEGATLNPSLTGVPEVFASGQSGLFDVLPSPTFAQDRQLYLSYACGTIAANHTCLARATLGENGLEQVEELFRVEPAKQGNAHFGGRLAWLADGTLIMTLGDGFNYREQAQNLSNHIGSIVRLNPDGSVPDDNPFVAGGEPQGSLNQLSDAPPRPEIYSYGHRNLQGLVVDNNDRIITHEHGPRGGDEINIITAGSNYGWPVTTHGLDYSGAHITPFETYPGIQPPLYQWTPSIAPSGMTRYDGELFPEWRGDLLVGSLVNREVHRIRLSDDHRQAEDVEGLFGELEARIRDVRTGPDGALYLLTDSPEGRVLRVTPARGSSVFR
ncbi:PQQ-dependent sugar dehydrogenase [Kushneria aurantia]|uniref:PQQ-dependent sugar dehydrogenase n=1 Tax=Kushneria aurantia TaxID=504092 RepID=A0ABV6G2E0_9GAMM|nr:PQQ-dependent sugar dehydrogenase [Kushneria aurantia]